VGLIGDQTRKPTRRTTRHTCKTPFSNTHTHQALLTLHLTRYHLPLHLPALCSESVLVISLLLFVHASLSAARRRRATLLISVDPSFVAAPRGDCTHVVVLQKEYRARCELHCGLRARWQRPLRRACIGCGSSPPATPHVAPHRHTTPLA